MSILISALAVAVIRLAPQDATADGFVAEALAKSPEVTAARATIEAAERRVVPARTLPDPSAALTYQNEGLSFGGLMLSQPLPWPGKLTLAGRIAESEARETAAGPLSRAQRTIEARVRTAWYELLLARSIDRTIDERQTTATQIEATTRERYAAGLAVQQDVFRAQIELARIDELKATQRAAIASKTAELNRLLGRPQEAALTAPHPAFGHPLPAARGEGQLGPLPLPAPLPPANDIVAAIVAGSPELAASQQGIETGRLTVDLARKSFLPDFVVSGGSMYRGSYEMGPMWQVGVGVSIPAWIDRRQRNQVAEAQARVAGREAEAQVVRQELELRTRERLAQLAAVEQVAVLYREKIVPLDELALESALASYGAGKVPFVTVLDAVNALYADRTTYLGRLAESARLRIAIDEARLDSPAAMTTSATPQQNPATSPMTGMR